MKKIGILFSGGLESSSLIKFFDGYDVELLYIKYGFIWETAELEHAEKIADFFNKKLTVLDRRIMTLRQLGFVQDVKDNKILMRNLTLLVDGAFYFVNSDIYSVAIGLFGDKRYPDTSLEYIAKIESLISLGIEKKFNILMPFYGLNKKIVFEKYKNYLPLDLVFSCTNPINGKRCHKCYKCKQLDKLLNSHSSLS
jgi:7-cyano-7-deazaguanine synthase